MTRSVMYWFVVDGAITRWPRIAVEAALLAGCFAHARGRSWGVLVLSVLGPTLLAMVATTDRLPAWGGDCVGWSHPLDRGSDLVVLSLAIAVVPWLAPIARALRAPR